MAIALIQIIAANTCDILGGRFSQGFEQRIWLEGDISNPQYVSITEASEDGDSNEIRTYTKVLKKYRLRIMMPEFFQDGLHVLFMFDNVRLVLPDGRNEAIYNIETAGTPEWTENGCIGITEVFFYTESYNYSKNSCCENLDIGCLEVEYNVIDFIEVDDPIYTNPLLNGVEAGDTYIIGFAGTETGFAIKQWTTARIWVTLAVPADTTGLILNDATSEYWFKSTNNAEFTQVPRIDTLTRVVDTITIKGKAIANTFIRVKYTTFGDPEITFSILANQFIQGYSFDITGAYPVSLTVENYVHGCEYGSDGGIIPVPA